MTFASRLIHIAHTSFAFVLTLRMAERVPLLHIVGTPSTKLQASGALLHRESSSLPRLLLDASRLANLELIPSLLISSDTLGDGEFDDFEAMSARVSARTARLRGAEGAGELVDELIKVALKECKYVPSASITHLFHTN